MFPIRRPWEKTSLRAQRRSGECEIELTPRRRREYQRTIDKARALLAPPDLEAELAELRAAARAERDEQRVLEAAQRRAGRRRYLRLLAVGVGVLLGIFLVSEIVVLIRPVSQGVVALLVFGPVGLIAWVGERRADRRVRERIERETR